MVKLKVTDDTARVAEYIQKLEPSLQKRMEGFRKQYRVLIQKLGSI